MHSFRLQKATNIRSLKFMNKKKKSWVHYRKAHSISIVSTAQLCFGRGLFWWYTCKQVLFHSVQYSVHLRGLSAMHTNKLKLQTHGSHEDCCHIWSFRCTTLSSFWKNKCQRHWYFTRNLQLPLFSLSGLTPFRSSRPTFFHRWLWVIRERQLLKC